MIDLEHALTMLRNHTYFSKEDKKCLAIIEAKLQTAIEALTKIGPTNEYNSNFPCAEEEAQFYIDTANKALADIEVNVKDE